jgi:hypothetical protein
MMFANRVGHGPLLRQWFLSGSTARIRVLSILFGAFGFATMELLHLALVKDLGRRSERITAESLAASVMAVLVAKLMAHAIRLHRLTLARLEVIREMNHHVRNALQVISFSCLTDSGTQSRVVEITHSVRRIDWALREILSREEPEQSGRSAAKAASA